MHGICRWQRIMPVSYTHLDKKKFEKAVDYALTLTTQHGDFYPLIRKAFEDAGVIFVILPNLPGSGINGATKKIGQNVMPVSYTHLGDWSRIIPGRCLCGIEIKRLDFVKRMDPLGSIREMDELLFEIPELVDYCVKIVDGKKEITALFTSDNGEEQIRSVLEEKDIRSWNCKKAKWEDGALYPGKRVTRQ